ncbi:MAG: hypothetical protein ACXAB7_03535, partial [Candidatus Kariarchaeaceae archaeon]
VAEAAGGSPPMILPLSSDGGIISTFKVLRRFVARQCVSISEKYSEINRNISHSTITKTGRTEIICTRI